MAFDLIYMKDRQFIFLIRFDICFKVFDSSPNFRDVIKSTRTIIHDSWLVATKTGNTFEFKVYIMRYIKFPMGHKIEYKYMCFWGHKVPKNEWLFLFGSNKHLDLHKERACLEGGGRSTFSLQPRLGSIVTDKVTATLFLFNNERCNCFTFVHFHFYSKYVRSITASLLRPERSPATSAQAQQIKPISAIR